MVNHLIKRDIVILVELKSQLDQNIVQYIVIILYNSYVINVLVNLTITVDG